MYLSKLKGIFASLIISLLSDFGKYSQKYEHIVIKRPEPYGRVL